MFRDTEEELARLERELLAEEPAEADWEDSLDILLDDDFGEEDPGIYQNYSNGYGRSQSSGWDDYSDQTDEDPEDFREAEPKRSSTGLVVTVCLLMLGIAGILIFLVLRYLL